MAISIDYEAARLDLEAIFDSASEPHRLKAPDAAPVEIRADLDTVFSSRTGAYRQSLLTILLVKKQSGDADLSLPSTEHGPYAYAGRSVDEAAVITTLSMRQIPVSRSSAWLSVLRRGKRFVDADTVGTKDRTAYLALNRIVAWLQTSNEVQLGAVAVATARRFLEARDAADIPLAKVNRASREQVIALLQRLFRTPSGGLAPVLVTRAILTALNDGFGLGWTIVAQGINAADGVSGAAGDITVSLQGRVLLSIEVTERVVDAQRVRSTMMAKVMPAGLPSYLFFVTVAPTDEARILAQTYFGQGHEVDFVLIDEWAGFALTILGSERSRVLDGLLSLLNEAGVPTALKLAWNEAVAAIIL